MEKSTKEADGPSTSGTKEAQAAQSKDKSARDSSVEDVGSKLEGTKISEANEGPAVDETEDKVKKVIDDYRKKLEAQLQFVQPWDRNIPGIMNEYTYFSPGEKNRVDDQISTPSKAWVVFIDEKVRDMVFGKFGGEKGQLVKSKRGTTTRVFMKKAFYQGIPHSSQCIPPKNDGIESTIFTDPDFIKWVRDFVVISEEDYLPSADVQRKQEEERNKGKKPEATVAPLVAAMLKAKQDKERKKEQKRKKKTKEDRDRKKRLAQGTSKKRLLLSRKGTAKPPATSEKGRAHAVKALPTNSNGKKKYTKKERNNQGRPSAKIVNRKPAHKKSNRD